MSDTLIADVPLQPEDPREWKSQAQELRAVETAQRGLPRGYKLPAAARPILTAAAKTGQIGDGKIFVTDIHHAVRIRTGETDSDAL